MRDKWWRCKESISHSTERAGEGVGIQICDSNKQRLVSTLSGVVGGEGGKKRKEEERVQYRVSLAYRHF